MRMIYYSIIHSVRSYGIIFWGKSSHSSVIFKLQKRVIRLIMGRGHRWEDNIKMDLQEVGGGCGYWLELAQDRDRW
jgi:hypothetical protein